jgi:hypothetical protein
MTKTAFYECFGLVPDSGNVINSWGAVQSATGRYLLQCWDNEKFFIKKQDRTDAAVMVVKLLSPQDLQIVGSGASARSRSIAAIRGGAPAFVAVSTGHYPNWIESANLSQVYPVLSVYEQDGIVSAKVGAPLPTEEAFGAA